MNVGQGRTRTKQKRQKKEQFVRPTMMTLVVPFFSRLVTLACAFRYNLARAR